MEGAGIKEEFEQFIHNAELAPFIADDKGRYYVLQSEARAYNAEVEAAGWAEEAAPSASMGYHSYNYTGWGW